MAPLGGMLSASKDASGAAVHGNCHPMVSRCTEPSARVNTCTPTAAASKHGLNRDYWVLLV